MALTESRSLYSVLHNKEQNTVTVTWMNKIFRDGVEIDSARSAEVSTFSTAEDLALALGDEAVNYSGLL